MRRALLAAAVVSLPLSSLLSACGSSSGPAEETPDDYVGAWTLSVKARAGCWPDFQLVFEIDRDDAAAASETRMNIAAQWWLPADPATRTNYTGLVDWSGKTAGLNFFRNGKLARFTATDPSAGRMEGTFNDGLGAFQVLTGTLPCVADATARKD